MHGKEPTTAGTGNLPSTRVFEVVPPSRRIALGPLLPADYRLTFGPARLVERCYLDTHDWRLWAAGATLTSETANGETSLIWRPPNASTVTADLATPPRFAADLPRGTLQREVQPLIGERALLPLAAVSVRQRAGAIRDGSGKIVARVWWERGHCLNLHRQPVGSPFTNMRLEGVRGYEGAWRALMAACQEAPFLQTPADGELQLAARARGRTPGDYSSRLDIQLVPELPAAEATRLILRRLLDTASANLAGTVEDLDPEFLHDLRVAVRRARSALGQLAGSYDATRYARLRDELRWLGGITGACRDLDVFLADLRSYQAELGSQIGGQLAPLVDEVARQRAEQHAALRTELTSPRLHRVLALWRRLTEPPRRVARTPEAQRPAAELGAERVQRAYRRMRRHARHLPVPAPPEGLHRLRIDAKKLRYLLEFFASLWGRRGVALIRHLKDLQDALGVFNDVAVQQRRLAETLQALLTRGEVAASTALAAGRLAALLEERQAAQRAAIAERLEVFFGREVRAEVGALAGGAEEV